MKTYRGIIAGALFGAALFFVPFILMRVLFFLLIIGFLFRLVRGGRDRWGRGQFGGWGGHKQFAFADYIRGMSDEEYNRFKEHFQEEHPGNATAKTGYGKQVTNLLKRNKMKKRLHFLIAFLAAALTFGSLMAFVGPQNSAGTRTGMVGKLAGTTIIITIRKSTMNITIQQIPITSID